jgi:hypothetical protein
LGLVRSITLNFSSLECMLRLYITLVRAKLEYASIVWNSIMSTDANNLEHIQQRFVALCFNCFIPEVHYCYSLALEELKLHTLCKRRHHLSALFLTQVYFCFKFWPSILEIVGLRVSADCSVSAPHVKTVPLLDVHQLLMLFAGVLTYSEPGTFSSIIFIIVVVVIWMLN